MTTMSAKFRSVPETEASIGIAGSHSVIVDRPAGKAGGQGLGFNGGQLLALAIGGCFCNDLYYVADDMGIALTSVAVDVTVTFEGVPLRATSAAVEVAVQAMDEEADCDALIQRTQEMSAVSNSISRGVPVSVSPRSSSHLHRMA